MTFHPERVALFEGGAGDPTLWTLECGLTWIGDFRGGRGRVVVPSGFVTDLASVPFFMTWLFPRYGKYTKAAIVHDYLCRNIGEPVRVCLSAPDSDGELPFRIDDRSDADEIFRDLMSELEVPPPRRWLMWSAVTWATLRRSLFPGRQTKRALQSIGVVIAIVAVLVAAWIVARSLVGLVPDPTGGKWLTALLLGNAGAVVGAAGVMLAGYIAQGRWERWASYLAVLGMTVVFLPFLLAGLAVGVLATVYRTFEWLASAEARRKRREWKSRERARPSPRAERRAAVLAS